MGESEFIRIRVVKLGTSSWTFKLSGSHDLGNGLRGRSVAGPSASKGSEATITVEDMVMVAETEKAIGIAPIGQTKVRWWIPKKMLAGSRLEMVGDEGWITIPRWLADNRGLDPKGE